MNKEDLVKELYKSLNGGEIVYFETVRQVAKEFQPKKVLEIGSGWALSAIAFLLDTEAHLTTIDKQGLDTMREFRERINLFNLWSRITMVRGDSQTEEIANNIGDDYDIVFIDGDHGYAGAKRDLELYPRKVREGGLLLMDDVCHYLNWEGKPPHPEITEYGVARAIAEWAIAHVPKVEIFANHNGLARIPITKRIR